MSRLTPLPPSDMSAEQREFASTFSSGRRAASDAAFRLVNTHGELIGPPATWVLSPSLGMALQHIGGEVRYGLELADRAAEAAILVVGAREHSDFEIFAHRRAAARAGWSDDEIDQILDGTVPDAADELESTAIRLARRMLDSAPDDHEFDEAVRVLGTKQLFELVTLIGYYRMVALQLAVFDVRPPTEQSE